MEAKTSKADKARIEDKQTKATWREQAMEREENFKTTIINVFGERERKRLQTYRTILSSVVERSK